MDHFPSVGWLSFRAMPPCVRGNPGDNQYRHVSPGSIPACAGEPRCRRRRAPSPGVYPRVCGGTKENGTSASPALGLSPRVRGNPVKSQFGDELETMLGLSPRVRGNHLVTVTRTENRGSIPACAGEPRGPRPRRRRSRVYPRVCGGTRFFRIVGKRFDGLSPRVRGNPAGVDAIGVLPGSIPACAGEPPQTWSTRSTKRVYPRVCGGTRIMVSVRRRGEGLSPRVRGNLLPAHVERGELGSIPACAGEPHSPRDPSPRVRGNRWASRLSSIPACPLCAGSIRRVPGVPGSIPACAGEPQNRSFPRVTSRVYPRVCGGTSTILLTALLACGLSPRVRGNPETSVSQTPW